MQILSDRIHELSDVLSAGARWSKVRAAELNGPDLQTWRTVSDSASVWTVSSDGGRFFDFWHRLVVIDHAPRSQFDAIHESLGQTAWLDGPTALLALGGRGFHGQRGRAWRAAPGNLFLTVALPVAASASSVAPSLIALPAVATADAIRACSGRQANPTIKWVNDILIDERKVAGVLAASLCRDETLETAVLGIGVNVSHAPAVKATPFVPAVGSLADAGIRVSVMQFLALVLETLADRWRDLLVNGPATLLQSYREASCILGERVRVWEPAADAFDRLDTWPALLAAGIVESIDADLSLHIGGRSEPVRNGRLALESACRALAARGASFDAAACQSATAASTLEQE
jgi:BirA family biotin operon repressor/biotin-[acetyl-CoA-carboxylase] ligase